MNNKDADETLDIHNLMGTFGLNCLYKATPLVLTCIWQFQHSSLSKEQAKPTKSGESSATIL